MSSYVRETRTPLDPITLAPTQVPASLELAYAAVNAQVLAEPHRWAGWKLGGTNHGSRKAFGVSAAYYGAIERTEIFAQPEQAPGFPMAELKGEAEIALRLSADERGYDAWCVALEMPSSPVANLLEAGVAALVADRCAAGALILGQMHDGALPDLSAARLGFTADDAQLDNAGLDNLTDTPEAILQEFLALARSHGMTPKPGDWVATGGITACCPLREGARVALRLDGRDELAFVIRSGGA